MRSSSPTLPMEGMARFRHSRLWWMATFAVVAIWFFPLLASHPTDADQFLIHASAIPAFDHISASDAYAKILDWYRSEYPGWFPVAPLPLALWLVDAPPSFVNGFQYLLVLLSFGSFAWFARLLFARSAPAILAVVIALCAWQLRVPHDPVTGTALITTWPGFLVLTSFALLLAYRRSPSTTCLVTCHFAFALSLLTGPVAWGIGIAYIIIALFALPNWRPALSLAILYVAIISVTCIIDPPSAPWLRDGHYFSDVIAQLVAALPTSYRAFGHLPVGRIPDEYLGTRYVDDRFINIPAIVLREWIAVAGLAILSFAASQGLRKSGAIDRLHPIVAGLALLLAPALALGAVSSWHGGLPMGQAFDVVYLEYFGVALLATTLFANLFERERAGKVLGIAIALAVFLLGYGNARSDNVAYARGARFDLPRSLIQRAGGVGFFDVLPAASTVALDPHIPNASDTTGIKSPAYMLFHYSGRRYHVVTENSLGKMNRDSAWLLQTSVRRDMLVSLSRFAGRNGKAMLADRAYGYTLSQEIISYISAPERGMEAHVAQLRDGDRVSVSRTCGAVPMPTVFDADAPTVDWLNGFFPAGPVGYQTPASWVPWGDGPRSYPKMYMKSQGDIRIHPSPCRSSSYLVFAFIAVTGGSPASITVISPHHVDRVEIGPTPGPAIGLEYRSHVGESFTLHFKTNAPSADLDPVAFRYERDVPRDLHVMIEPAEISESQTPYALRVNK